VAGEKDLFGSVLCKILEHGINVLAVCAERALVELAISLLPMIQTDAERRESMLLKVTGSVVMQGFVHVTREAVDDNNDGLAK
jgi:hypothetical protein